MKRLRLRRVKDHFMVVDNGKIVGSTKWSKNPDIKPIYMHQCQIAFMGEFHEFEIDVDVDMTIDDRGYVNKISKV